MNQIFGKYAIYYDLLYNDKNYERECDLIEQSFKVSSRVPEEILDIGCGTCNHLIPLSERGYRVTGVDASPNMIQIGREKLVQLRLEGDLRVMDVRDLKIDKLFDACICMFAVIGYVTKNQELDRTFQKIRLHLKSDAVFLMDFWYGPAVQAIKPSLRVKKVENEGMQLIRSVRPEIDTERNVCRSHYHIVATRGTTLVDEFEEVHTMRYFFPEEIEYYLSKNGFKLIQLRAFPDMDNPATEKTWNASVLAQAM